MNPLVVRYADAIHGILTEHHSLKRYELEDELNQMGLQDPEIYTSALVYGLQRGWLVYQERTYRLNEVL